MSTNKPSPAPQPPEGKNRTVREVELLKVVVTRQGQQVSAQWAIHPQMKVDLLPEEWKEVSELMMKVTQLVGARFAQILAAADSERSGTA